MVLVEQSCKTCAFDGICYISVGLLKLFEGSESIEIYNPENGKLTQKGEQLFSVIGKICENHIFDEDNVSEE